LRILLTGGGQYARTAKRIEQQSTWETDE
jgi:hypothetical protein